MKQNKVLPAESVLVWYENLTFNTPLELKRLGGLWITLPAANRGQGLATDATGV